MHAAYFVSNFVAMATGGEGGVVEFLSSFNSQTPTTPY